MENSFTTSWLFFHLFQTLVMQFYAASKLSTLTLSLLKSRNVERSKELLGSSKRMHSPLIDYCIGIISLGLILFGFINGNKELYNYGKQVSIFGFLFTTLAIDFTRYKFLEKKIPLVEKRNASLKPRALGRIIPLWGWGIYLVACVVAVLFIVKTKIQILFVIGAIILFVTGIYTEKRKKLPVSFIDDDLYRKSEAWAVFLVAWSFPIMIPMRNKFTVYGVDAAFSLLPMVIFILFLNSKIYKKLTRV